MRNLVNSLLLLLCGVASADQAIVHEDGSITLLVDTGAWLQMIDDTIEQANIELESQYGCEDIVDDESVNGRCQ